MVKFELPSEEKKTVPDAAGVQGVRKQIILFSQEYKLDKNLQIAPPFKHPKS